MYLTQDERPVGEITKLSQAIRVGAPLVHEDKSWGGCALKTAAVGLGMQTSDGWEIKVELARRFNLSFEFVAKISSEHYHGKSREQIACELEARGL